MPVNILAKSVTEVDVVNTTTETDILSYTVLANTLSTNGALRITVIADYLNNSAATTSNVVIKIKFGATTMWADTTLDFPANLPDRYAIIFDLILSARNSTSSQALTGKIMIGVAGGATTGIAGNLATDETTGNAPLVGANASEDSTANKDFKITITHQANNAAISFRHIASIIEQLSPVTNYNVGFTEDVIISASVDRTLANSRAISNTVTQSDSMLGPKGANRTITENTSRGESWDRSVALTRTESDTTVVDDTFDYLRNVPRSFSETTVISSSFARSVALQRVISDTTSLSDSMSRTFGQFRDFSDTIIISSSIDRVIATGSRFFDEFVDQSDNWERAAIDFRRFFQTVDTSAVVYDPINETYVFEDENSYSPNHRWLMRYHGQNPQDEDDVGAVGVRVPASPTNGFARVIYQYPYQVTNTGGDTAASLILTSVPYYFDFDMSISLRTVTQLRDTPNPWEVAWIFWHFNEADGGDFHHYYLAVKSNGTLELGRKDNSTQAEEQTFLDTSGTFTWGLNDWNLVRIRSTGNHIEVWIDGSLEIDIVDDGSFGWHEDSILGHIATLPPSELIYSGKFGLYNEDAEVEFGPMTITADYRYWDDIALSDTFTRSKGPHRDIIEDVIVADVIDRSQTEQRIFSETTVLSDTFEKSKGNPRAISDTVTMSSDMISTLNKFRDFSDTVVIGAGSFERSLGLSRSFMETTPQSDSFDRVKGLVRVITDSITVAVGTFVRIYGAVRASEDDVDVNDSFVTSPGKYRSFEEIITVSDSWGRVIGLNRVFSDTTVLSDSFDKTIGIPRAFTETTTVTSTFTRLLTLSRIIATEGNAIFDSMTRILGNKRTITETTAVTDTLDRSITLNRVFDETVAIVSTFTRLIGLSRAFASVESVVSSDSWDRSIGRVRTFVNNIVLSDSWDRFIGIPVAFVETVTVAVGTFVRVVGIKRVFSENTTVSDTLSLAHALSRAFTETVTVTAGTFTRSLAIQRAFNESGIVTADNWDRQITLTRVFTNTITVDAGSFVRNIVMSRAFAETVVLSSTVISYAGKVRTFTENIALSESWIRSIELKRAISNAITTSDTFTKFREVAVAFSDTVVSTDSMSRGVGKVRDFIETTLVGMSFSVHKVILRAFSNTVIIADSFARTTGLSRLFSDAVSLVDSWISERGVNRVFTETTTTSDSFGRYHGWVRTITDTIAVTSTFIRNQTVQRSFTENTTVIGTIVAGFNNIRAITDTVTIGAGVFTRTLAILRSFGQAIYDILADVYDITTQGNDSPNGLWKLVNKGQLRREGNPFYSVAMPGDDVAGMSSTGSVRYGIEVNGGSSALLGQVLFAWHVRLRPRVTPPSGNITAKVRRSSDDAVVATFTEVIDSTTMLEEFKEYLFTLPTPYTLGIGDRILIEYGGPDGIEVEVWATDHFDGANTRRIRYQAGVYSTSNNTDLTGSLNTFTLDTGGKAGVRLSNTDGFPILYDDYPSLYQITEDDYQSGNGQWIMKTHGHNPEDVLDIGQVGVRVPGSPTNGFSRVFYAFPYTAINSQVQGSSSHIRMNTQYIKDFDLTFWMRTIQQKRNPPNPWEVAWLLWHYNEADGGKYHHYFLTIKSNSRLELGRKDNNVQAEHQYFLVTTPVIPFVLNQWNKVRVRSVSNHIMVWINDSIKINIVDDGSVGQAATDTDLGPPPHPPSAAMYEGQFALYTEDAEVEYSPLTITPLDGTVDFEENTVYALPYTSQNLISTESGMTRIVSNTDYGDFDLTTSLRTTQRIRFPTPGVSEGPELTFRYTDAYHYYYILLKGNAIEFGRNDNSSSEIYRYVIYDSGPFTLDLWEFNTIRVKFVGNRIECWINGNQIFDITDNGTVGTPNTDTHFSAPPHAPSVAMASGKFGITANDCAVEMTTPLIAPVPAIAGADIVAVSDSMTTYREFTRNMVEPSNPVASVMEVKKTIKRVFTETVPLSDIMLKITAWTGHFTESISLTDNWISQRFITRWKKKTIPSTMLLYFIISKWPQDGSIIPRRSEIDFGTGSRFTGMNDVSINVHAPRGPQDFVTIGDSKKHKILKCEVEIYVRDTTQPEFPELMWNIRDYLRRFLRENRQTLFEYTIDVIQQTNVRSMGIPDTKQMKDLWRTIIDVDMIYQDDY